MTKTPTPKQISRDLTAGKGKIPAATKTVLKQTIAHLGMQGKKPTPAKKGKK
jgi:hypothetical protein